MRTQHLLAWTAAVLFAGVLSAADPSDGLKKGTPDLKSAGPLAFAPHGILLVGDSKGAAIFAIDTGDRPASPASGAPNVSKLDERIAGLLGASAKDILINDLAVNPESGKAYLSVSRGKGPDAKPALLRVDRGEKIEEVPLTDVLFAKAALPNASDKQRQEAITDLAYVKGKVVVAGLSNEQFASTLRVLAFPFQEADKGASVEIFHGAHGRFETQAPIRTFVPFEIDGQAHLLAAYTCTPLVKIPVSELKPGAHVKGTTVAELGNRNRPLDMIVYEKNGKTYLLLANSSRGMMKITVEGVNNVEGITNPVRGGGTAGLTYDTIKELKGVEQLDKLDKENALVLVRAEGGLNLQTVPLP